MPELHRLLNIILTIQSHLIKSKNDLRTILNMQTRHLPIPPPFRVVILLKVNTNVNIN